MQIGVEIAIEFAQWETSLPDLEGLVRRVVDACVAETRFDASSTTELSLLFCDDREIRALNSVWRRQDKPTNVLSFPAGPHAPGAPARLLGDIVLGFETVEREAQAESKTLEAHVSHLIAHGLLHLFGYDHETPEDAENMEARERAILARLGLPDPYRDREIR